MILQRSRHVSSVQHSNRARIGELLMRALVAFAAIGVAATVNTAVWTIKRAAQACQSKAKTSKSLRKDGKTSQKRRKALRKLRERIAIFAETPLSAMDVCTFPMYVTGWP